jgi:hypothetical protein
MVENTPVDPDESSPRVPVPRGPEPIEAREPNQNSPPSRERQIKGRAVPHMEIRVCVRK